MAAFAQNRTLRLAVAALVLVLVAACASTDKPKPEALEANPARLAVKEVWRVNVGATALPLEMRAVGEQLWVASTQGDVVGVNASTGALSARAAAGTALSAGVGADKEFVSFVTRENQVITLREQKELWRQKLPSLVLTPPLWRVHASLCWPQTARYMRLMRSTAASSGPSSARVTHCC